MKADYMEMLISNYREAEQERRNRELAERLLAVRSAEDMLQRLHALEGLNVPEREFAHAV